jgi:hypothetical protein
VPLSATTPSWKGARHGNIAHLGKVAHSGDVTVQAEGQPTVLGQVTLCCKVVVLATLPSLADSLLKSPPVFTGVIAGHAGVVTMLHVHCGQHFFDLVAMAPLPLWRRCWPLCSNGACPITTPLAMHCNLLHHQLSFSPHCCPWQIFPQLQRGPSWQMAFLGEVTILGKVAILASLPSWQPRHHGDFAVLGKSSSSATMLSCYSPFLWQGHLS